MFGDRSCKRSIDKNRQREPSDIASLAVTAGIRLYAFILGKCSCSLVKNGTLWSMDLHSDPVVQTYATHYSTLSDDELRNIVRGDVPGLNEGKYTFSARKAAHQVLRARGADQIPGLPWLDPSVQFLPLPVRLIVISAATLIIVGLITLWVVVNPIGVAADAEVCEEARAMLRQTEFAYEHELSLSNCRVEHSARFKDGLVAMTPVHFDACIDLLPRHLAKLASQPPRRISVLRRFASKPVPGKHCPDGGIRLARLMQPDDRPWFIEVRLLEATP